MSKEIYEKARAARRKLERGVPGDVWRASPTDPRNRTAREAWRRWQSLVDIEHANAETAASAAPTREERR